MGDLRVTIEHGSGFGWRSAAPVAVIGGLAVAAGASGLLSAIMTGLIWVASVLTIVSVALSVALIRAMRRRWRPNYVRSIHGDSQRNVLIDENARLRAEIRAMRTREKLEEITGTPITAWQARVLGQVLQEGGPGRLVVGRSGLYQQVPPIPGHE